MDLAWWIAVIGVPLVGAIFAVDFYIHRTAATERERAIAHKDEQIREIRTEKDSQIAVLHARVDNVTKEFSDYKVNSAMLYSTVGAVSEIKREINGSLGRIEDKIDRLVERRAT